MYTMTPAVSIPLSPTEPSSSAQNLKDLAKQLQPYDWKSYFF